MIGGDEEDEVGEWPGGAEGGGDGAGPGSWLESRGCSWSPSSAWNRFAVGQFHAGRPSLNAPWAPAATRWPHCRRCPAGGSRA